MTADDGGRSPSTEPRCDRADWHPVLECAAMSGCDVSPGCTIRHTAPAFGPCPQPVDAHPAPTDNNLVGGECDWGNCSAESVALRWSASHGWLPVCDAHRAPTEATGCACGDEREHGPHEYDMDEPTQSSAQFAVDPALRPPAPTDDVAALVEECRRWVSALSRGTQVRDTIGRAADALERLAADLAAARAEAERPRLTHDRDLLALREGLILWKQRALAAAAEPCTEHDRIIIEQQGRITALGDELQASARAKERFREYMKRARVSRDRWKAKVFEREAERDALRRQVAAVRALCANTTLALHNAKVITTEDTLAALDVAPPAEKETPS